MSNTINQQKEKSYTEVENKLMLELSETDCLEDIYDVLYAELQMVIRHYNYNDITPDDLIPDFVKTWGLKDGKC